MFLISVPYVINALLPVSKNGNIIRMDAFIVFKTLDEVLNRLIKKLRAHPTDISSRRSIFPRILNNLFMDSIRITQIDP